MFGNQLKLTGLMVVFCFLFLSPATAAQKNKKPVEKRIFIYLLSQVLRCYEGDQIVYETRISSGKNWHSKKRTKYKKQYWIIRVYGSKSRCIVKGKYHVLAPWKMELSESPKAAKGKLIRIQ